MIQTEKPIVEEILGPFRTVKGIEGYKNHVYRVINFSDSLAELSDEARQKISIAACFHDLGLFTDNTFDYIRPSIDLASDYLSNAGLDHWTDDIASMIEHHHSLRAIRGSGCDLTELFRKADLIEFSLGLFKFGVNRSRIRELRSEFPNIGFHKGLATTACRWILRHPLNPLPVVRW